jgi:hypothetical protein
MKYETPELNALTAVNAIQNTIASKKSTKAFDFIQPGSHLGNEPNTGYADWE